MKHFLTPIGAMALVAVTCGVDQVSNPASAATIYTTDFTFNDGDYDWSVAALGSAHGTILGGLIENRLQLEDTSSADLFGGNVNALYVGEDASATIHLGSYINTYIGTSGNSVLNIYGGRMPDNWLTATDSSVVNFYLRSYEWTPGAGQYGDGEIIGVWGDLTPFTVVLEGPQTFSHLAFHVIPEPTSLVLGLLGTLFLAYRSFWQRDRSNSRSWRRIIHPCVGSG